MTLRPVLLSLCSLLALPHAAFAQSPPPGQVQPAAPVVTVTVTSAGVRFAALGPVSRTRLEVYDSSGSPLSDSGFLPGNVRDWSPAGLADGRSRGGRPYQEPFRLRDDINFEKDYRIRLHVASPQSGRLYLLNEGPAAGDDETPTFNVLFPSSTANSGSALLQENQQIQIPQQSWFQFDAERGTEKIWLVWAAKDVPELEAVKGFANARDRGVVGTPALRAAVHEFLKAHSTPAPSVERDAEKKDTRVRANGEILAHAIRLEHH